MIKKHFIAIIGILILLTACAGKETKEVSVQITPQVPEQESVQQNSVVVESSPDSPAEDESVAEVENSPAPLGTAVIVEKTEQMSPELRELLGKADQKVKSYKYLYSISADNKFPHNYFIKGNYIKIKLFEVDPYIIDNYYDAVYLDTRNKKAYGYCENLKRCLGRDVDNTKKVFNLTYVDYRVKTPYEFLKDIAYAEIIGPEVVENRQTTKIRQANGDILTDIWLDETYGMPRRIRVTQGEKVLKTYNFADMTFNTVKDDEVWRAPK
ncbi:MAG: hypothetical protein HY363_02700 [Candidatus Aenigmarchaeota archaeon]|nr:hypothetical protein [Candidatus Aenigmarchaeota archaeon]